MTDPTQPEPTDDGPRLSPSLLEAARAVLSWWDAHFPIPPGTWTVRDPLGDARDRMADLRNAVGLADLEAELRAEQAKPRGAFVEIVERVSTPQEAQRTEEVGIIRPTEVRINGTPILCPADDPVIRVEPMEIGSRHPDNLAKVTLTMWARRVVIGVEAPGQPISGDYGRANWPGLAEVPDPGARLLRIGDQKVTLREALRRGLIAMEDRVVCARCDDLRVFHRVECGQQTCQDGGTFAARDTSG